MPGGQGNVTQSFSGCKGGLAKCVDQERMVIGPKGTGRKSSIKHHPAVGLQVKTHTVIINQVNQKFCP